MVWHCGAVQAAEARASWDVQGAAGAVDNAAQGGAGGRGDQQVDRGGDRGQGAFTPSVALRSPLSSLLFPPLFSPLFSLLVSPDLQKSAHQLMQSTHC